MYGCVVNGGGYMEGYGSSIWTEFPLMEFAGILFRKVVIGWYVGHKNSTGNKAFVVYLVEHYYFLLYLCL